MLARNSDRNLCAVFLLIARVTRAPGDRSTRGGSGSGSVGIVDGSSSAVRFCDTARTPTVEGRLSEVATAAEAGAAGKPGGLSEAAAAGEAGSRRGDGEATPSEAAGAAGAAGEADGLSEPAAAGAATILLRAPRDVALRHDVVAITSCPWPRAFAGAAALP